MHHRHLLLILVVVSVLIMGAIAPGVAAADDDDDDDDDDDGTVVNVDINLDDVVDAISDLADDLTDFTGSFSETMTEILFQVFYQPFLDLLAAAASAVLTLLVWLPDPTMDEVLEIHRAVYTISLVFGGLGFTAIGFVYMGYEPFGIPYQQVRPLIPKLVAALVFGGVAPWLLKYPVDLAELTAAALAPRDLSFTGLLMLSGELVVVAYVEAFVVLGLLAVLSVQKIYILFAAATAPLIAVLWAVPFRYTQSTADQLIGAFWGFLLIGPLDIVVFRLTVALLSVEGFEVADWVVGLGGTFLMLGIPFMVVRQGMTVAAPVLAMSRRAASPIKRYESETVQEIKEDVGDRLGFDWSRDNRFDRDDHRPEHSERGRGGRR